MVFFQHGYYHMVWQVEGNALLKAACMQAPVTGINTSNNNMKQNGTEDSDTGNIYNSTLHTVASVIIVTKIIIFFRI